MNYFIYSSRPVATSLLMIAVAMGLGVIAPAHAQQQEILSTEDFDALSGSGFPGTNANGQGGWTVLNNSPTLRNDFTTGSLSGNVFYSDDSTGSQAYRNDGFNYLSPTSSDLTISFTGRIGGAGANSDRWSRAGVGYYDGTNLNPGIYFGSFGSQWGVALGSGTGGGSSLATSTDGFPGPSTIFDMRLLIDLLAETATLEVENSEIPGINWFTPTGMQDFSIADLDINASDGQNPLNWNSLYIRSIVAGDTVDNIVISSSVPEPSSIALWVVFGLAMSGYGYLRHLRKKQRSAN